MKVLVYTHRLGIRTETFIYNELSYLQKHCKLCLLYNQRYNPELFPFRGEKQVPHYEYPLVGSVKSLAARFVKPLGLEISSFKSAFEKAINEFQPDIIHLHYGTIASRVLDYYPATQIPVVISFHGYDASSMLENSKSYRRNIAKVLNRPNVFPIFVSHFMQRKVEKHGLKFNTPSILYYGTDLSTFTRKKRDWPRSPFVFLQVSSFSGKKGHEYTLNAFKRLLTNYPEVNVKLILAGGGVLWSEIKEMTESIGISHQIEFPGWVDVQQTKKLMEQAHAFVHHSVVYKGDREGIPNAIMEAMGMELPILSTFHSGIPELVENGINGYLVEEKDVETYAQRMFDVLSWGYLPQNRKKIKSQFEKQQHGAALISIYEKYIKICNHNKSNET